MKKLLKRLIILAAPIIWRKIQQRRHGGHRSHYGHHRRKRYRHELDWL